MKYIPTIGLEIHAELKTRTKMFCDSRNDPDEDRPNVNICPVCMGHPGTLPVTNKTAVEKATKMSLALNCTVNENSHFDRKHYFYPDLPSGFQISQFEFPLASKGKVEYDLVAADGTISEAGKVCGITRLHLENDAGKLTHRAGKTLCDYNRAGTPLMEIVTEPDLRTSEEAVAFAEELRRMLIAVGASEADMFKGMMRFDASISLREVGTEKLNPRSEIKNLNSFKALEKALQYEEKRLRSEWESTGGPLAGNITVGWLDDEGKTRILRNKENADDYRYFPEPDIPPLVISAEVIAAAKANLPPLPRMQKQHYVDMGLTPSEAQLLTDDTLLCERFTAVYKKSKDAKRASSLVLTQMRGFLNTAGKSMADAPSSAHLLALVSKIEDGTISANASKEVLEAMIESGKDPESIISEKGMAQISDDSELEEIVQKALAANADAVESFKKGKASALGAIVGWIMKETKGQANPGKVQSILQKAIQS